MNEDHTDSLEDAIAHPWAKDPIRREWHRNDHAGDPARTHLMRLPDRTLVPADRYLEALREWERREILAGRLEEGERPSRLVPLPLDAPTDQDARHDETAEDA